MIIEDEHDLDASFEEQTEIQTPEVVVTGDDDPRSSIFSSTQENQKQRITHGG